MYCSEKHFLERLFCLVLTIVTALGMLWFAEPNETIAAGGTVTLTSSIDEDSVTIKEPEGLYAQSAVLMDADSGRILFEKNGMEERAMASTTKIMTCILALESGKANQTITASQNASSQPEVHLGVRTGQRFEIKNLLYSLMLESHNDAAVMVAEGVSGSVQKFAALMNEKAEKLGCNHTYFITPNGLDAVDINGKHHTTAEDLARIMKYCIMDSPCKDEFLKITQTEEYSFSDCDGQNSYQCYNHNAFLKMMTGALSGKTGFTADAGYCYVGALRKDDRTFVVALLACGWPSNRGYKWADTRTLMTYGMENFHYHEVDQKISLLNISVENGVPDGKKLTGNSSVKIEEKKEQQKKKYLLRDDEKIRCVAEIEKEIAAPVAIGRKVGIVKYMVGENILYENSVIAAENIEKYTIWYCFQKIIGKLLINVKINQVK